MDSEGEESAYTVPDLFTGLDRTIWRNGSKKEQSSVTQRLIEKTYVSALCRLYQEKDLKNNGDLNAVLLAQLKRVAVDCPQTKFSKSIANSTPGLYAGHGYKST